MPPVFTPFTGMPGVTAERIARHRAVSADGYVTYLPGGEVLDGAASRDLFGPDGDPTRLSAGLLLGRITASGKYANAFIGATAGVYTSGGTSLTLTAAQAAELVRRVGASGTFNLIGPATAAATVNVTAVTYSAVNTTTGAVTITNIGADRVAGCLVGHPSDGSHLPATYLPDGWETPLPWDLSDAPLPRVPVEGRINGAALLPWPADTALQQWIRDRLNDRGRFVFTERY